MASPAWILLGFTLLSVCINIEGILFDFVRSPGNPTCARLNCVNDVDQSLSSVSTKGLVIYEISGGSRSRLASIDLLKTNLNIESSRVSVVNGTGHITKNHVDITLDFHRNADCTRTAYICELEYTGAKGGSEKISETVAPGEQSGECSCSTITEQLVTLTNDANEIDRQVFTQRRVSGDLNNEIRNLRQDLNEKQNTVDTINNDSGLLNEGVNNLIQGNKDISEEIAAQSQSDALLASEISALQRSDENQERALAEQSAKDEANDVVIGELNQVDRLVTVAIKERANNDVKFNEDVKQLTRRDDSLDNQIDNLRSSHSSLREAVNNLRQGDQNQANDVKALQRTDEAQAKAVSQLSTDFEAQVAQISSLEEADVNFRSALDGIDKKNTDADSIILNVRRRNQENEQELAGLREKYQIAVNQLTLLRSSDEKIQKDNAELRRVDTVIQRQIDDLSGDETRISDEISSLYANEVATAVRIANLKTTYLNLLSRIRINQSREYQRLEAQVLSLTEKNVNLLARLSTLIERVAAFQHYIQASHVTTVVRTTTRINTVHCSRGMAHVSSRERVLVDGNPVICDTETDNGGWLVIQTRVDNTVNFDRNWDDYKTGFGIINGNYWVGLDALSNFVEMGFTELRVDLVYEGKEYYAHYDIFSIGSEEENYRLSIGGYSGTAGDSLSYHNGMSFSTKDADNDADKKRNCADESGGGGWFKACYRANIFGVYGGDAPEGLFWSNLSPTKAITRLEIKVRSAGNVIVSGTEEHKITENTEYIASKHNK